MSGLAAPYLPSSPAHCLPATALKSLREEHTRSIEPARAQAAEALHSNALLRVHSTLRGSSSFPRALGNSLAQISAHQCSVLPLLSKPTVDNEANRDPTARLLPPFPHVSFFEQKAAKA